MKKHSISVDGGEPIDVYIIPIHTDQGGEDEPGEHISSRPSTAKYRDGWDKAFAQKPNNSNN